MLLVYGDVLMGSITLGLPPSGLSTVLRDFNLNSIEVLNTKLTDLSTAIYPAVPHYDRPFKMPAYHLLIANQSILIL